MRNFDQYSVPSDPSQPAAPGTRSFDVYDSTPDRPTAPAPTVGYLEDMGKGFVGGVGRGTTGTIGLPGTVGNLTRAGLRYLGASDEGIDTAANVLGKVPGIGGAITLSRAAPDAQTVQHSVEGVTGKFYEPQTVPGQYASTVGEFLPGAAIPGGGGIGARAVNTIVPAITSETMGQLTKDTKAEPWARFVGGLAGGLGAAKAITPMAPASASHRAAVDVLDREAIPMTAGQRTGSKALQWVESNAADMPLSGRAGRIQTEPLEAFDRYVTNQTFDRGQLTARGVPRDVNLPDAQAVRAGAASLSDEYERLAAAGQLRSSPRMQNRMTRAQDEYERLVLPHERTPNVEATRNNIVDRLVAQGGRMAGDEYQSIRSQIGKAAKASTNTEEARALREMKYAMDEAMQAGLPPAEAQAWVLNNRRYANMKQTAPAVEAAATSEHLSPLRVASELRNRRGAQYAQQRGDLDEVAQAAAQVLKPLPNSGTAARTGAQQLYNMIPNAATGGATGGLGFMLGGPLGAAIGAAAPFIMPRLATSRLGQAYLGNRALPQNARDILSQTLAEQAISQPSGIERNKAGQDEYDRKRLRRVYIEKD